MVNSILFRKNTKPLTLAIAISISIIALLLTMPALSEAAMDNNLTNEACLTCHINYPAVSTYDIRHKWDVCDSCHTDKTIEAMWNCLYCHMYPTFKGGSPYWLRKTSTYFNEPMNRHSWDGMLRGVDATFTYHNNNMTVKHSSSADVSCLGCHNSSLTEEHSGGVPILKEDFEDTNYNFTFSGNWVRYSSFPHDGSYSFKSPTIGDQTTTSMETTVTLAEAGKVSFWYRVSSEENYDKFYFYLDGVEKLGGISGNVGWYQVSYPLNAGTHTLRWSYVKDQYVKDLEDSVCIDDIVISKGGRALDCNTCHENSTTTVKNAIATNNTNCNACHTSTDHKAIHNSIISTECAECHQGNLSTEHKSRTDDQGNYYNCDTCHKSTDPVVLDAINNHNKECTACHGPGSINHDLPHISGMDSECLNCHTQYLNTDHQNNTVSCSQCHNSSVEAVQWAVQTGDKYCGTCHGDSHGVPLVPRYETDIPLYPDFTYSSPMPLNIWDGENWIPTNLAVYGKVIVSNHSSSIIADMVWDYYQAEMTANGWNLISSAPAVGVSEFQIEYTKDNRKCIIWFHSLEDHNNSIEVGSRIEIIYN